MNRNYFWLVIAASVVAVATLVSAIIYVMGTRPDAQQMTNERVSAALADEEGFSFEIDQQIEAVLMLQSTTSPWLQVPVRRPIFNMISVSQKAGQVLQQLIDGPLPDEAALPTLSPNTRLKEFYVSQNGVAYAIFDRGISENHIGGVAGEMATVYSIVNTLCVNFPSIRAVKIIVDGRQDTTLAGHVDLTYPLLLRSEFFEPLTVPVETELEGDAVIDDGDIEYIPVRPEDEQVGENASEEVSR